eukprot:189306-Rhodomonas_salina.1
MGGDERKKGSKLQKGEGVQRTWEGKEHTAARRVLPEFFDSTSRVSFRGIIAILLVQIASNCGTNTG